MIGAGVEHRGRIPLGSNVAHAGSGSHLHYHVDPIICPAQPDSTRTQEFLLMNKSILGLAVTALLTMTVHTGFAAEAVHVPATPHAAASASIIARVDRALRDYVAASSTGDDEAIARIVTSDAVVEYMLEEPGTYLGVEAAALSANCSGNAKQAGAGAYISNLWIFPTNDSNAVFVQYTTSADVRSPAQLPDSEHLALLQMRGDRIFKMHYFSADAGTRSTRKSVSMDEPIVR
jgi:hypothetical protein